MIQFISYLHGSTPDDFNQAVDAHPFQSCPDSPNCTYHSVRFQQQPGPLFEKVVSVMNHISPHEMDVNSQSLQIEAVFRISVFGFKDDVIICIKPSETNGSILHIKSSSRVGKSDLGVNRRRIQRILSQLNQQIS